MSYQSTYYRHTAYYPEREHWQPEPIGNWDHIIYDPYRSCLYSDYGDFRIQVEDEAEALEIVEDLNYKPWCRHPSGRCEFAPEFQTRIRKD